MVYLIPLSLLTIFYIAFLLAMRLGLTRLREGKNEEQPSVSVVLAARNEEDNIGECLSCLVAQDYPQDKLEVIVVDDRSQDATAEIIRSFPQVKLYQVEEKSLRIAPKKYALDLGIKASKGEIILTTDADCRPGPEWVRNILRYFEPEVGLVAGFSPLEIGRASPLRGMLALESLALASVAAGGIGLGWALTCTGRNLSYRKKTYDEVGGLATIGRFVSGDDDLFLQLVDRKTKWKLRYAFDPKTIVPAKPPQSLKDLIHQRIRHASKGRYYPKDIKALGLVIYFYNLALLILFFLALFKVIGFPWLLLFLLLKILAEFSLLLKGARLFGRRRFLMILPLATLLHVPFIVFFGALGQLGRFRWKGESFKATVQAEGEVS